MCEFKLRVYLLEDGDPKLISKDALNVKFADGTVTVLREDGSILNLSCTGIIEVDAERQAVILKA
ncbi:MAG: hypothetical protein NDF55_01160 [archaeon GB-1867-005]|nr:hypothetical protein [Candidatus Culexmicrobium cathedralense]